MTYASHQALTEEIERQIASDFAQRGQRLLPLMHADVEAARDRAEALFRSAAQQQLELGNRLRATAARLARFINEVSLSSALIDALNRRRTSRRDAGRDSRGERS